MKVQEKDLIERLNRMNTVNSKIPRCLVEVNKNNIVLVEVQNEDEVFPEIVDAILEDFNLGYFPTVNKKAGKYLVDIYWNTWINDKLFDKPFVSEITYNNWEKID